MEEVQQASEWQISSHEAGTLLEKVPVPGTNFSSSLNAYYLCASTMAPRPSPNPSPFIFSI